MLAIQTKFVGPTNHRDSRYIASVMEAPRDGEPVRKVIVNSDHKLDSEGNHKAAAVALIRKLGWTVEHGYGPWIVGGSVTGYVFVCDTKHGNDRMVL